jgi:hypothetical protein
MKSISIWTRFIFFTIHIPYLWNSLSWHHSLIVKCSSTSIKYLRLQKKLMRPFQMLHRSIKLTQLKYQYNQCLSPLKLWVRTLFILKCTWYNIMWSMTCDGSVVFSTNKTDSNDITEILLKVELNTINQTKPQLKCCQSQRLCTCWIE